MADAMIVPASFDEFAESYKIVDSKEVYTNGTELIPIFRVKQWLEHQPTADVVEVVRCKDCKYSEVADNERPYKIYCFQPKPIQQIVQTEENRFCSYGERKDAN